MSGSTLWHGRFEGGPAEALMAYTVSLPFDRRLGTQDVRGSRAHVAGLIRAGLMSADDGERVDRKSRRLNSSHSSVSRMPSSA